MTNKTIANVLSSHKSVLAGSLPAKRQQSEFLSGGGGGGRGGDLPPLERSVPPLRV